MLRRGIGLRLPPASISMFIIEEKQLLKTASLCMLAHHKVKNTFGD